MNKKQLICCTNKFASLLLLILLPLFAKVSHAQTESPKVVFKTSIKPGENISFGAQANGSIEIEGVTSGQWLPNGDPSIFQVAEGQTITLKGDVTHLYLAESQINSIDVSQAPSLAYLSLEHNELTVLDLSQNIELKYLYAQDNKIAEMSFCSGGNIFRAYCTMNQLKGENMEKLIESFPDYTASEIPGIFAVIDLSQPEKEGNVCSKILVEEARSRNWKVQAFDGSAFGAYEGTDEPGGSDTKEKIVMRTLIPNGETITMKVSGNGEIKATGINGPIELNTNKTYTLSAQDITLEGEITSLEVPNCNLITLNTRRAKHLETLDCSNNPLKRINLSQNTALKSLACAATQLAVLDIDNNTALETLDCSNNALKKLDVGTNVKLQKLFCNTNQIRGYAADFLVQTVVNRTAEPVRGTMTIVSSQEEGNVFYKHLVTALKGKGWDVNILDGNETKPYEGKVAPQITFVTSKKIGETVKLKINSDNGVVIDGLDGEWINDTQIVYTIQKQDITLQGEILFLHCYSNGITEIDFSLADDFLQKVDCSDNLIDKEHMEKLIVSLPNRTDNQLKGEITVHDATKAKENNVCTKKHSFDARQRGWKTMQYVSEYGYIPYEGDDEFDIPQTNNTIKIKTERPVGSSIAIEIDVKDSSEPIEIDGLRGNYEPNCEVSYIIEKQEFSLRGNIKALRCDQGDITAIDLSDSHSLQELNCRYNKIKVLDLHNQRSLKTLFCQDNEIEKLDFSGNPKLEWVACHENNIRQEGFQEILNTIPNRQYNETAGVIVFFNAYDANPADKNQATPEQVVSIKAKNWDVKKIVDRQGLIYVFEEYLSTPEISCPAFSIRIDTIRHILILTGMQGQESIALFDMNGRLLQNTYSNSDGAAMIDVQKLPQGQYIVRVGKTSRIVML